MELPKDKIIELLRSRGENDKADRANDELPDQVDTDKHGDLLDKLGIDPGAARRHRQQDRPLRPVRAPRKAHHLMATRDNPEERK